jgi:hypothetical protein
LISAAWTAVPHIFFLIKASVHIDLAARYETTTEWAPTVDHLIVLRILQAKLFPLHDLQTTPPESNAQDREESLPTINPRQVDSSWTVTGVKKINGLLLFNLCWK